MHHQKIIIFSGPSGGGKSTLVQYLLCETTLPLTFSISATSRVARLHETDGKDYYFLSKRDFLAKIEQNAFIEYEEVYSGTFYGTLTAEVERLFKLKKNILFDIDVAGAVNVKKKFTKNVLTIFVRPPNQKVLLKRLSERKTEMKTDINKRVQKAEVEMRQSNLFDTIIINDDLSQAKEEAAYLVEKFISS